MGYDVMRIVRALSEMEQEIPEVEGEDEATFRDRVLQVVRSRLAL